MGIVGLGSIGTEIVKLVAPFGIRVSGIRRRANSVPSGTEVAPGTEVASGTEVGVDEVLTPDSLPDLLSKSDVVVLAVPHTPDTKQLIGRAEIDRMKRGACLINIARGKLIDDAAVIDALRDGRLGGAALDVFTREPLEASSPYWDLPNVIITPHTSGAMHDYWTPLVALFSENLRRFEKDEPLLNAVDKIAGY
jgi:phosphoglycerate dehydrogenase-like enzyme